MKSLLTLCAFLVVCSFSVFAQVAASGTVKNNAGEALPGVTVVAVGTTTGTVTDLDGKFQITMPKGTDKLEFSFVGFESVSLVPSKNMNVILGTNSKALDQVVVVGYSTQSKRLTIQNTTQVSSESLRNIQAQSPQQLLQGQAAGVQMTNSSGVLGAASNIRVRGVSSITGGGSPLFVIDGVPLNDGDYSNALGGGSALNPLLSINPNDIESMTVLKDAAAVSIYGSRGSNGVILITTKKGKRSEGKSGAISFSYNTAFSNPTNTYDMMSGDQFVKFRSDYITANGGIPPAFDTTRYDWKKNVLQTGRSQNYVLSTSGGNENGTYYLSGNYSSETGYTIGNSLDRFGARMNFDYKVNKYTKAGANISINNVINDRIGVENSTAAPLTSAYLQLPTIRPTDSLGNFVSTGFIQNVVGQEALNTSRFINKRTTGNTFLEVSILPNLKIKSDFGIDFVNADEKIRQLNVFTPGGYGYKRIIDDNKWLTTNTINYSESVGNHFFNVLAGYSFETSKNTTVTLEATGFANDKLPNIASASTPSITSETVTEWAIESQFARLNYRYNDRYLAEATIRRDGSSRFGPDKRYGIFYAGSIGWVLSDEKIFENVSWLNLLKPSFSYGTSGNDRIGNFSYPGLYATGVVSDYDGLSGLTPSQTPNPLLSWEETSQADFNVDFEGFDNRLRINLSFYNKVTNGLLLNVPLPYTTGFAAVSQNVGKMGNKGIDLSIGGDIIRTKMVSWESSINMGFLKNTVLDIPNDNLDLDSNAFIAGSAVQNAVKGRSLNEFYLVRYKGINAETGNAEWYSRDNPDSVILNPTAANRVYAGSAIPLFTGGWNNNVRFGNFDLNILFNFSYGNKVFLGEYNFINNIASAGFNKSTDVLNYWREDMTEAEKAAAYAPALNSTTAALFNARTTAHLMDASYLRMKNLSLGYTIPANKYLSNARVFIQAQNLLTFTKKGFRGQDPEISANGTNNQVQGESFFAIPQAKSFGFGLNLTF